MNGRSGNLGAAFAAVPPSPDGMGSRVLDFVRSAAEDLASLPELDVSATDEGVSRIDFGAGRTNAAGATARRHAEQAREELADFFAAERGYFTVAVDLSGVRPFQRAVLDAAGRIPLGEVRSYGWIATGAGNAAAVRAAGTALRTNPVPLIVPCHRVVRTDGSLGGYAGGPLLKRRLLRLESEIPGLVGRVSTKRVCRAGCSEEKGSSELDRIVFATVDAARESGYRACRTCRPMDSAPE